MASPTRYYWQAGDTRWWVATKYAAQRGYSSTYQFVVALNAANPQINGQWRSVVPDTPIQLPSQQAS